MREISVPPLVIVPPETNVTDLVLRQAAKASNPALFSRLDAAGVAGRLAPRISWPTSPRSPRA